MFGYTPWNDIKKTCESFDLHDPQIINSEIWVFRGRDVQPTPLSPEELKQVLQATYKRVLREDRTREKYARLLMPLAFLSGLLIAVGIATGSLDGFAAVYQSAPRWMQMPWVIAVMIFTVLASKLFFESTFEAVCAYRQGNPYWKSFAVLMLRTANIFLLANLASKFIAVHFMTS